ncbi:MULTISPECIES: hypothetical protein [unclassified Microbacterium]|uniref:hypothetical protein n=1 Tax=unclassified Microbacterium TaxID=2609290 RepID=UPI000CFABA5F|nr:MULTISPECIES: hypothetical protein [unclassified Microbacterium]PQZ60676.1 hypothetical protein CQ032_04010 [Microbacterium sp. MYb43]PQZ82102.1 hypothetical protein CQ031_01410 [Microbacterium sp. MYb40]PRB22968.1 hypothetical protein CQ037_18195 [Microbacterium sp. MYb50]PRB24198.1 hypothetical protein CQ040_02820 [Microbacterium sp. MYb54]PRB69682.1 hypothetical protein CQ021_02825 [Microbacterium sp. MYb24]
MTIPLPPAGLTFVSTDGVAYGLDKIAANILDRRAENPEASIRLAMPAHDRAVAEALLRLALSVVAENGAGE